MNAKEFHEHYGMEVVRRIVDRLDVSMIYWNGIKNGHKAVSSARALELAQISAEYIGPSDEPMTVIDLLGLRDVPGRITGMGRGSERPEPPKPKVKSKKAPAIASTSAAREA
ncbi:hypothetical protein [Burkholderia ubonensis]|uniref:hypothetical protein n=1 Tax=Burkholderia ubonensis TaxID=101571 RepID=UPI000751CE0D|nr:hypothetical protein [Burkholderia ubonensis]KVZ57529.1 hypothetical protein WL19_03430 [Burkholderia ubonensis]